MTDLATRLVELLSNDDARLCSVPHSQYETYTPYLKAQAIDKIRYALAYAALENMDIPDD